MELLIDVYNVLGPLKATGMILTFIGIFVFTLYLAYIDDKYPNGRPGYGWKSFDDDTEDSESTPATTYGYPDNLYSCSEDSEAEEEAPERN